MDLPTHKHCRNPALSTMEGANGGAEVLGIQSKVKHGRRFKITEDSALHAHHCLTVRGQLRRPRWLRKSALKQRQRDRAREPKGARRTNSQLQQLQSQAKQQGCTLRVFGKLGLRARLDRDFVRDWLKVSQGRESFVCTDVPGRVKVWICLSN